MYGLSKETGVTLMYKCINCGAVIEEPALVENHLTNDAYYVIEEVCPHCNNYCYEIEEEV